MWKQAEVWETILIRQPLATARHATEWFGELSLFSGQVLRAAFRRPFRASTQSVVLSSVFLTLVNVILVKFISFLLPGVGA